MSKTLLDQKMNRQHLFLIMAVIGLGVLSVYVVQNVSRSPDDRGFQFAGALTNIGVQGGRTVTKVSFDQGEASETIPVSHLAVVITPDSDDVSNGAALSLALSSGKRVYGYKYSSQNAEAEIMAKDRADNGEPLSYNELFPGQFFVSDTKKNDGSFIRDFEEQKNISFLPLSQVTLDRNAQYVFVTEDEGTTFTVQISNADLCLEPISPAIELIKRPTGVWSGGVFWGGLGYSPFLYASGITSYPDGKFLTTVSILGEIQTRSYEPSGVVMGGDFRNGDTFLSSKDINMFAIDSNAKEETAITGITEPWGSNIFKVQVYQKSYFYSLTSPNMRTSATFGSGLGYIALADNGGFMVIGGSWAQVFDSKGVPLMARFKIEDDWSNHPLAIAGDQYIVLLIKYNIIENGGLYFRRYSLDGLQQGDDVRVGNFTLIRPHDTYDNTFQVAGHDDGSFMVARAFNDRVYGRIYHADGSPSMNEFALSERNTRQFAPTLSWSDDGTILTLWREETSLGDRLLGRLFSRTGTPLGPETEIGRSESIDPLYENSRTYVSADAHGNFVVEWRQETNVDATILARRFRSGACGAAAENTSSSGT